MVMQHQFPGGTTTVPVPDHPELRTGTLQSIIRQSGLDKKLFLRWDGRVSAAAVTGNIFLNALRSPEPPPSELGAGNRE